MITVHIVKIVAPIKIIINMLIIIGTPSISREYFIELLIQS